MEPELPGLKVEAWGDTLAIRGVPRGRTTYRVTLSSEIADTFGQSLEPGGPLAFAVGPAPAALSGPGGDFVVLDPAGGTRFPVHSINHASLRVEAYAVGPEDWAAWHAYRQRSWRDEAATPPGRRVIDTTVRVAGEPDTLAETRIDLAPALEGGLGQVVLVVRPTSPSKERRREVVQAWIQATRIGLDAFADEETLVAWASDLADGRPLARRRGAARHAGAGRPGPHRRVRARPARPRRRAHVPPGGAPRARRRDPPVADRLVERGGGLAEDRADRRAALLRVRRPEDVPPRRGGARQGLAAADRGRPPRRRGGAPGRGDGAPLDAPRLAGQRGGEGRGPRERHRRLRPRAEAPRDDEPRRRRRAARGRGHRARRAPARPRLPGAGVPAARVRGEGGGERGPALRGRRRHRDGVRGLLRGGRPARRGRELARHGDAGPLPPAEPRRLRLRDVRPLVGAGPGPRGAGARGDAVGPHGRLGRPPAPRSTSTAAIPRGRGSSARRPR